MNADKVVIDSSVFVALFKGETDTEHFTARARLLIQEKGYVCGYVAGIGHGLRRRNKIRRRGAV